MESVKSTIPEITEKTRNKVFRESESKGMPFLVLKKGRKYGKIEYDFNTIKYILTDNAVINIEKTFNDMIYVSNHVKRSTIPHNGFGVSPECDLEVCRDYSEIIRSIIMNKDNWIKIK